MKAILMFYNCEGQSHKKVFTDHNFWSKRKAEADSNRGPSAYQPYRYAKSTHEIRAHLRRLLIRAGAGGGYSSRVSNG